MALAEAYGASQYVAYALNGVVTLNGRAEVWRDNAGVFAVAFPDKLGLAKLVGGDVSGSLFAPPTTYGELTFGVTYKPTAPPPLTVFQVRPELRFDHALSGTRSFNAGRDRSAFTGAVDIVIGF